MEPSARETRDQPVVPPYRTVLDDEVIAEFHRVADEILRRGVLTLGPETARFERLVAEMAGCTHAVAVTSGTAALDLLLRACGLRDREVLVPTNTNPATALAIIESGNHPKFYDGGLWAGADDLEKAASQSTAAVVIVHLGGFISPDIEKMAAWCAQRDIPLLEDAAHAHGAVSAGRAAGSFGRGAAFSFFPTKRVTTAEGGAVTTADAGLVERLRRLRNQGKGPDGPALERGGSYRLSEFAAALGSAQLGRLADTRQRLQRIFVRYDEALEGVSGLRAAETPPRQLTSGYKYVAIADDPATADAWREQLARHGIGTSGGVYHDLLHDDPRFAAFTEPGQGFPAAERFARSHVCLPAWPAMTDADVAQVIRALRDPEFGAADR
jgi:perosamine synthetase